MNRNRTARRSQEIDRDAYEALPAVWAVDIREPRYRKAFRHENIDIAWEMAWAYVEDNLQFGRYRLTTDVSDENIAIMQWAHEVVS